MILLDTVPYTVYYMYAAGVECHYSVVRPSEVLSVIRPSEVLSVIRPSGVMSVITQSGVLSTIRGDDFKPCPLHFAPPTSSLPHPLLLAGTIWLDNVACLGSEGSLMDCSNLGFGVHNCDHTEDVSVMCSGGCGHNITSWLIGHSLQTTECS